MCDGLSMTWSENWSVLLSGSVASLISILGVFGVFWLTTRHDRRTEGQRRKEEALTGLTTRRAADVSRIHLAVAMQPKDMTWAPVNGHVQALELLAACMNFATNQGSEHPAVAAWVIQQH
jgi:hypothetical protein